MAKKFLFVCTGILMLAIAYHLVSPVEVAQSQEGERPVMMSWAADWSTMMILTDQGNFYEGVPWGTWTYRGAWPGNPPTLTQSTTWGQIKTQHGE